MARHSLLQSFVPGEGNQRVRTGVTAAQKENSELIPLLSSACAKELQKLGREKREWLRARLQHSSFGKQKLPGGAPPAALCPSKKRVEPAFICFLEEVLSQRMWQHSAPGVRTRKRQTQQGRTVHTVTSSILLTQGIFLPTCRSPHPAQGCSHSLGGLAALPCITALASGLAFLPGAGPGWPHQA